LTGAFSLTCWPGCGGVRVARHRGDRDTSLPPVATCVWPSRPTALCLGHCRPSIGGSKACGAMMLATFARTPLRHPKAGSVRAQAAGC
jgi:hypothetical protein